jgi:crossover junction endodeoxyribonuclease RuvC
MRAALIGEMHPTETAPERVLAVDPSLRSTGYAVLERCPGGSVQGGAKAKALAWGVIKNRQDLLHSGCLLAIHTRIRELVEEYRPISAAFESVIFVQSYKTAIVLGCARGAAVLSAAQFGLPIYEYAPRRVKQAVVGRGGAEKEQVAFMVRALLGLTETPVADAADALAVGLTHFQAEDRAKWKVGEMERI